MDHVDTFLLVHAVLRALVLPPGGLIVLGLVGLVLLDRAPRLGRALIGGAIGLLFLLSLPPVAFELTHAVECCAPLEPGHAPKAQVIVVLGGGIVSAARGAAPAPDTLERLAYGAALARETGAPLLLSGGAIESRWPEAEVMARTLKDEFGLEARWLETRSRTTAENARYTAELLKSLGLTRVLLVTSAVHMRRALEEFHRAGVDPVPAPAASTGRRPASLLSWLPSAGALWRSHAALYELVGELVAVVGGRR